MKIKKRLDQLLQEKYPQLSRTQIQSYIMQGKVMVDDKIITKPGIQFVETDQISADLQEPKYVSRGGFKLEHALDHFDIDVAGLTVLDAGLSTGGFTDCLLQRGVEKIYGIDVGRAQVHEKIRRDPRVLVQEGTNLRTLEWPYEKVDLVTLDLSFISLLKVMNAVRDALKEGGKLVALIKPQFEAERHQVGKGGIVKDPKVHREVVERVVQGIKDTGFEFIGVTDSPITGTEGNKEFLAYFQRLNE